MTFRQFSNAVVGYRRRENTLSKERWMIARKMMWACIVVHVKNFKEQDLMTFHWESKNIKKLQKDELDAMLQKQAESEDFWARYDSKKAGKA